MKISETYSGNEIPKRTKWVYSSVAAARDASYALVSLFLITWIQYSGVLTRGMQQDGASSSDMTVAFTAMYGVITALVIGYRIFDALNDPFMGVLIEKLHFKSGKYKPWILIGGVLNSIVVIALFGGPTLFPGLTGWAYVAWFAVFYLLWGMTFTMNDIAYWGMLPSLSSDEKQRNNVTTIMNIFCSLGQFAVAGLGPILSGAMGYNVYIVFALVCGSLLAATQIVLFFFLKEHTRDVEEEKKHPQPRFKDMFTVLKQNDQVRVMVIALFLYYLGSGILNALGLNYFYFAVNYTVGSTIMTIFTVIYGLGTILAQFLFPLFSSKFSRSKLLFLCFIGLIIGYALFFIYGLPLGNGNYISPVPFTNDANGAAVLNIWYVIPLCLIGLLIFFCQGLFYMTLLIMMTNTIEYNEYKFGERKEAIIFSLRPLTTKLASSLQQGILYLFIALAALAPVINSISSFQNDNALGNLTQEQLGINCDAALSNLESWQVLVFKLGVAIIPMVLFIVAYFILKKFYKIDEKTYNDIVKEIEQRKANENPELQVANAMASINTKGEESISQNVESNTETSDSISEAESATNNESPATKNGVDESNDSHSSESEDSESKAE